MRSPRPRIPAGSTGPPAEIIPVPAGTRDVLPDEMRELRAIQRRVLDVFAAAGYGEVATPALEYEDTMRRGDPGAVERAYRVADESGKTLVARFDSTIPIARLAATRYRDTDPPLRFCYAQPVYRAVEPKRAESREFLQVGMELLGAPGPDGDAEAIALLCRVLDAAGLRDYRVAVGDAGIFGRMLDGAGLDGGGESARDAILYELETRDLVGLERELRAVDALPAERRAALLKAASSRGGPEILDDPAAAGLAALHERLDQAGVSERIIYDLGLARAPGYYTGTVLEVFDPSIGFPLGGGGRYDDLVGRFGRDLAAFGFALNMERLHVALSGDDSRSPGEEGSS